MKKENAIRGKSFRFAIRIVNLYKHLTENKKEYVLAKQVLRSGTAIGAMVEEAIEAESTADFIHKLSIFNFQFSISSDPLFEKYYGWTPYQYSMNNPVNAKDGNGKAVQAVSIEAKQVVIDMIPIETHQFIKFNSQSYIDASIINSGMNESCNFKNLKELVNNPNTFSINVSDKFQYKNVSGELESKEMGPIRVDPSWEAGAYTLSTKELGLQGLTLFPSVGNEFNSSNSNVNIYINSNLSSMGKAETASHELLGHAFISSLGLNPEHNYRLGGEEGNIILKTQIIQSTNETRQNISGGNK